MLEKIRGPIDPHSCQSCLVVHQRCINLDIFHQALVPVVLPRDDSGSGVHVGYHIEQDLPTGIGDGERSNGY